MRTGALYSGRAPVLAPATALARSVVDGLDLSAVASRVDRRMRSDLAQLVRICVQELTETPDETPAATRVEPVTGQVEMIARRWAQRDLPIEVLHRAVHAGVTAALLGWARGVVWSDARHVHGEGARLIDVLRILSASVARGYAAEVRAMTADGRVAAVTLASRLLAGHPGARITEYGAGLSNSYLVVAVAIGAHPQESDPLLDVRVVARRKLRRIQAELATGCRPRPLSLLSVDGGTILIPSEALSDPAETAHRMRTLIDRLAQVAGAPVTATFVEAGHSAIPRTTDLAHELLDLALHLNRGPGLHRFRDLACEYQLSRPGRANRRIRSVLDPLRGEPILLETLRTYLDTPGTQDAVARRLDISVGTLRRRLGRIEALTGLDPEIAADAWQLRSSLVACTALGETPTTTLDRAG